MNTQINPIKVQGAVSFGLMEAVDVPAVALLYARCLLLFNRSSTDDEVKNGAVYQQTRTLLNERRGTTSSVVARLDGKVVGFILVRRPQHAVQLEYVAVDSQCRRLGVFTGMLSWLLDSLRSESTAHKEQGTSIWLLVNEMNCGAIDCYKSNGFVVVASNQFDDDYAELLYMERGL